MTHCDVGGSDCRTGTADDAASRDDVHSHISYRAVCLLVERCLTVCLIMPTLVYSSRLQQPWPHPLALSGVRPALLCSATALYRTPTCQAFDLHYFCRELVCSRAVSYRLSVNDSYIDFAHFSTLVSSHRRKQSKPLYVNLLLRKTGRDTKQSFIFHRFAVTDTSLG